MIDFFEKISQIPRPSHHEDKIVAYLEDFAIKRNLEFFKDEYLNIIIKKPASNGRETEPSIILQAHSDMVCEKDYDKECDFLTDPIDLEINGDIIKAKGTTLGADDGIGVAMILSILDSKEISHPALECLFTSAEEVGMVGAKNLNPSALTSKQMINLDTEEEGYFITGCAGGGNYKAIFTRSKDTLSPDCRLIEIEIRGLIGGHSGTDIHKGLGNANTILAKILSVSMEKCPLRIVDIHGGSRDNAIPREAYALISIEASKSKEVTDALSKAAISITNEFKKSEPELTAIISEPEPKDSVNYFAYTADDSKNLVDTIVTLPNGVVKMCENLPDLVETSLSLGVVNTDDDRTFFTYHTRSSKKTSYENLKSAMSNILSSSNERINGNVGWQHEISGEYPAWEYKENSLLTSRAVAAYKKLFQKEPIVTIIHAGLECGIISEKIPGLDVISIGPDITGAHSPGESLSISSAERTYNLLLEILS